MTGLGRGSPRPPRLTRLPSLPYVNEEQEHLLVFGLVSGAGVGGPGLAGLGLVLINDFA